MLAHVMDLVCIYLTRTLSSVSFPFSPSFIFHTSFNISVVFHQMAEEISNPLCEANKLIMVSSGGGEVGAAKLTGEVLDIMTRLPETVEKLTGISISLVTLSCTDTES